jgi:hypothetical protein
MTEQLQKIVTEELVKLPEEIQGAINSVDWAEISKRVGLMSLLTDVEVNKLQTEVFLILISFEPLNTFKMNLENHVGITESEADKINAELIEKVFNPVKAKLKENIEKSGRVKGATWKQNINFIVSGGNYAAFLDEIKD